METHYITQWEDWKELCEKKNLNPYENTYFEGWEGGGISKRFEYTGDIPEKESREDILKWIDERIKSLSTRLESSQNFGWHDKVAVIEHELSFWKQIKSLLTPIPKDKLDGFMEKWGLKFPVACAVDYK